jgi:hypothetical protein
MGINQFVQALDKIRAHARMIQELPATIIERTNE